MTNDYSYKTIKIVLDFVISLIALVILIPIFVLIAVLIKLDSKGPVFFMQKRLGENKQEFYMIKFRTMHATAPSDVPTELLQNPFSYITRTGRFLRKSSIDELPQIINILKGDMSIVGPRPALSNQTELIAERDKYQANNIRPGLTGWAQINGRDEVSSDIKALYDGEYVNNMSFILDTKIILKTVIKVFKSEGVKEGNASAKTDIKEA